MLRSEKSAAGSRGGASFEGNEIIKMSSERVVFYLAVLIAAVVSILVSSIAAGPIALLVWLIFKHFLCDYLLQTGAMLRDKANLGRIGGYLHGGLHAVGSGIVIVFFAPWWLALVIMGAEFVVHVLLDWGKAQWVQRLNITEANPRFWHLFGLDQWLHALTYLVIAMVVFR